MKLMRRALPFLPGAMLSPMVLAAGVPDDAMRLNREIRTEREHLQIVATHYLQTDDLSEDDFLWLKTTADRYGLQPRRRGDQSFFNALLQRVDRVPPSILAAHALLEGRAAAASGGDARRCLPCRSPHAFTATRTDWRALFQAVNHDASFERFRQRRADARLAGQAPQGADLSISAGSLVSGPGYGQRLQHVIQVLHLGRLDRQAAPGNADANPDR